MTANEARELTIKAKERNDVNNESKVKELLTHIYSLIEKAANDEKTYLEYTFDSRACLNSAQRNKIISKLTEDGFTVDISTERSINGSSILTVRWGIIPMTADIKKSTVKNAVVTDDMPNNAPTAEKLPDGQFTDHYILSGAERTRKYIRPFRTAYKHLICNTVTTMPLKCAETFAVNPKFYGKTFCTQCQDYFSVGQFIWTYDETKVGA